MNDIKGKNQWEQNLHKRRQKEQGCIKKERNLIEWWACGSDTS